MQRHHHQLSNGLTLIGEHESTARTLAAGFFVRTGARDETPEISGVSHFLEHMMFKGTARRSPEDVNREFDEMGARYNAFTSDENTVYYGNVLPRFQERLTDLLADMMRPALRDEDFNVEKNVILEEIAMYQDRPQYLVFDLTRATFFQSHPMGASVLGTAESIRDLQREQMQEYFSRRYAANNLTFVLTGNYDWETAKSQIERLCGGWNTENAPREVTGFTPSPTTKIQETDKFNRAHIYLMAPGLSAQDKRRYAAAVASEAIGAAEGSRLYWALVHPGIAEAAQIGHDASDGVGVYYGYILADPARAQESLNTLRAVVAEACATGLKAEEVERAKRRMASHMVLSAETPMGRLRPVGMDWVYRQEQKSADDSLQLLLDVSLQEVNELLAADPFNQATIVGLGPLTQLQ
ncbi:MAG: insulinase family protein [Abitibacteriaceae bacterium]|nr:insulinase family protein [Abditibacteriaceae bacterium]MBV9866872.1 insulinase family protein [Abditibacteriaceae bacterium]